MELKYLSFDQPGMVKDVNSKKGVVTAYYSVFGNVDSDGDIVDPGAGKATIAENGPKGNKRVKHFKWHDPRFAPGKITKLGEDKFGGYFTSTLSQSTLGRDTLIEYKEEIITEHSFGYETTKERTDNSGINHIEEYSLWEVSSLTAWGANPLTRTQSVKNIKSVDQCLAEMKRLTSYLEVGEFSDGFLEKLEKEYAALSVVYKSLTTKESSEINLDKVTQLFKLNRA